MVRTQIYLDEGQKSALDRLSAERGATVSDLVRQAVDRFIGSEFIKLEDALDRSFGIWRNRRDLDEPSVYIRNIRSEWEEREHRSG